MGRGRKGGGGGGGASAAGAAAGLGAASGGGFDPQRFLAAPVPTAGGGRPGRRSPEAEALRAPRQQRRRQRRLPRGWHCQGRCA